MPRYIAAVSSRALQRVLSSAQSARTALARVFASIGIEQPRMSDLRERLGLDKSIASRVARAVRMS